jgi:hypothetical protein
VADAAASRMRSAFASRAPGAGEGQVVTAGPSV